MADPVALPTADQAFGARPLPSAADAFPPPVNTNAVALGGADMDEHFSQGSVGQLLEWFGKGAKQGWGTKPLGLDPETDKFLQKYAPDYGVVGRAFHDEIVRPAAAALDFAMRAPGAIAHGIYEVAPVVGGPLLAGMEAFPAGHLTGFPKNVPTPQAFARAADLGVIGKGEAGYQDLPTAEAVEALSPTGRPSATEAVARPVSRETSAAAPEAAEAPPAAAEPVPTAAPDIHAVAREIAPDTFAEYDALSARRDTFRRWLGELSDSRANGEQAQALQGRIDDILGKVNGVEEKLTKAAVARLQAARAELDGFLRSDTPDMARVRQDLQKTDYAMRDLAPDVSAAYRQAAERMPKAEEAAGVDLKVNEPPAPEPAAEAAQAPEPVAAPEIAPKPEPAAPGPAEPAAAAPELPGVAETPKPAPAPLEGGIAGDITRQLVTAGRPAEEAQAAAALVQAHYEARAERFGGTKGTAEDLYRAEAPNVRAGRGVQPAAMEFAQKGELGQAGKTVEVGGHQLPLNDDGTVTLYHATKTAEQADRIIAEKTLRSGGEPSVYLSTVKEGTGYGEHVVAVKVDPKLLRIDDEFPDGRADFAIDRKAAKVADAVRPGELEQTRRGKIRLATDDAKATITLFKDADASTFIHETGHHWLEELVRDAADERAPEDLRADAATVRHWLGVEDGADIPTRAHEKFARGFERYMMEGHAPSAKLAEVFAKFRDWLTRIYETVAGLRSPINDEIRGAFDRMLASSKEGEAVVAPERGEPAMPSAPGRELGPTAIPKSRSSVYEPVPTEPRRLVDFLRREGGLRDDGGEISHIIGGKNQRPGLINGKGKSLDDAALRAWEEGYFPEHGENRPTINDLLDAIREDVSGNAQYSHKDRAMAEAFRGAMDRNAEIDRLGEQMGISPRDYTREQFWDMAAEHLSREEQAREIGSLDASAELDFAEAERRTKEHIESRGDAWEPGALYGIDEPRTLEDMENAYKSEAAAVGNAPEGASGTVEPGSTAGGAGSLQGGIRQGGRGAGPSGRAGAGASEAPRGPHAEFGPADDGLIDKAGNIRLDNLNAPDDIDAVIREAADRNGGFMAERRGVMSDGQILDLADALGKDPAFLDAKKIGQAFNGEEILAARKLLVQSSTAVRDAMSKAAVGGDAELAQLAQAIARHEMIQGKVSQATAEWGRAGRAFRALEGWEQARDLNQFLKENGGRDLNQLSAMARLGKFLNTPGQVSKFIADTSGGKVRQAIIYYWVNTLISGPITHLTYSVGNAVNALWTPLVETPVAAASGTIREALGVATGDRVYFNETSAQLYGLGKGFRDGLATAVQAYKTGVSPLLPGERVPARMLDPSLTQPIPGPVGYAIGVPGRAVSAIHSFFKSVRYEQNIQALAMRDALSNGLEGNARDLQIARLTQNPTPEMMDAAAGDALKELYMRPQPYNSPGAYLTRATNSWLPAKILAPFVKIGSEIVRNAFAERTLLGFGSTEVRGNLLMREGGAAFDTQLGKVMAGTGLMGATVLSVLEGAVTGDGPADPNERRVWLLNHTPNSVAVGPLTFSYARLGHLGMLVRFAANMTETSQRWNDEEGSQLARSFFEGITRSVLDETWMRGVKDFFDAIYHSEEHFDRWMTGFIAQWTPFSIGLGQVARKIDPYQRETRDLSSASEILNQIKAHTPLWSQTLPPRRDVFGEPITNGSGTVDRYVQDKVAMAMNELHIGLATPQKKIRGVPLTQEQYDDYSRLGGRFAKMQLDAIIGPGFAQLPPEMQIKMIKETVTHAREAAATQVMMQSVGTENDIIAKATDAKSAGLQGASPLEVKQKLKAH